jgi:hypothetical protein
MPLKYITLLVVVCVFPVLWRSVESNKSDIRVWCQSIIEKEQLVPETGIAALMAALSPHTHPHVCAYMQWPCPW